MDETTMATIASKVVVRRIPVAAIAVLTTALGALALFVLFFSPHCSFHVPFMAKGTAADCRRG